MSNNNSPAAWKQRAAAQTKREELATKVNAAVASTEATPQDRKDALKARLDFAVALSEAVVLASTLEEFSVIQKAAGLS